MVVTIQNGLPRGGSYTDPAGNRFGYGIFWTRIINEGTSPLELSVNFPVDSFAISTLSDSYLKLFLPPSTISLYSALLFSDGPTDLKYYLDAGINKPTMLKRTIHPKEEYYFYIGMLFHAPEQNGEVRTGIVLKEQDLFYKINIPPFGSILIPCGQIVLKN